jgi:hypothetical protein
MQTEIAATGGNSGRPAQTFGVFGGDASPGKSLYRSFKLMETASSFVNIEDHMNTRLLLVVVGAAQGTAVLLSNFSSAATLGPASVLAAAVPTYDVQRDFSTNANPNGVWSYGYKSEFPGICTLLDTIGIGLTDDGVPLEFWSNAGSVPVFYHNATTNTGYNEGWLAVPPDTLIVFPGTDPTAQFAVARLTTPPGPGGVFSLQSYTETFYANVGAWGTNFHVLLNDAPWFGEPAVGPDRAGFTNLVFLSAGDTLDFTLGPGASDTGLTLWARLWFLSNALPAPAITQQPQSVTTRLGSNAVFTASAEPVPVTFQWLHNGTPLPDATNRVLQLNSIELSQAGDYALLAANAVGSVTSAVATLAIDRTPLMLQAPSPLRLPPGWTGQFAVQVRGEGPLTYEWYHDGSPVGGANEAVLVLANLSANDTGLYSVVVANAFGAVTGAPVALTLTSGVAFDLERDFSAVWNPNSAWSYGYDSGPLILLTNQSGLTADNGVVLEGWRYNETEPFVLRNATTSPAFLGTNELAPDTVALFCSQSSVVGWGVVQLTLPPGGPSGFRLSVFAEPFFPDPDRYDFYFGVWANDVLVCSQGFFDWTGGSFGYTNLLSLKPGDALSFFVGTSELLPGAVRLWATLDGWTNGLPLPSVTNEPQTIRVRQGQSASFAATVDGAPILYYQWLHDGSAIAGETNSWLVVPDVQRSDTGQYSIIVSNNGGTTTGLVATLLLDESPIITSSPQALPVMMDCTARFDVVATGAVPLHYQWRFNGANLPGATGSTFVIPHVRTSDAGSYDVVVANDQGGATSAVARLAVVLDPVFDVRRDFSLVSNPNGVWTYGGSGNVGVVQPSLDGVPLEVWQQPFYTLLAPRFFHNPTATMATRGGPSVYPPGVVVMFPSVFYPNNTAEIRLTIPLGADGLYEVNTTGVPHSDGEPFGDIRFGVVQNNDYLLWQLLPDQTGTGYTNQLNLVGGDTLTFKVVSFRAPQTGRYPPGLELDALVQRVAPGSPRSRTLAVACGSSSAALRVDAVQGYLYRLLCSTNLVGWVPIATNAPPVNGVLEFTLPTIGFDHAFYRVVTP